MSNHQHRYEVMPVSRQFGDLPPALGPYKRLRDADEYAYRMNNISSQDNIIYEVRLSPYKYVPRTPWSESKVMGAWAVVLFTLGVLFSLTINIIYGWDYEFDTWMNVILAGLLGGAVVAYFNAAFFDIRSIGRER